MTNENPQTNANIGLISNLVAAYVSNNHVAAADLPTLIASVHSSLGALNGSGTTNQSAGPVIEKQTAAQIRKRITPDALISFIDGKPYKTLKRHLTMHGFTPAAYSERFGLPSDYPLVAQSYSEKRSSLARAAGLGQHTKRTAQAVEATPVKKARKRAA